jgi:hypothetical protein
MQQQIAWINVVKEIPPNMYEGYRLKLAPMIVQGTENVFGPRLAPQVFEKIELISADPMQENEMLLEGFPVEVKPGDDDQQHIQAHMMALQAGDPHQTIRNHIAMHMQQMQAKAAQQAQQAGPQQGGKGGGGPKPGAQPAAQRPAQQPAGAIHRDNMPKHGAVPPPRTQ